MSVLVRTVVTRSCEAEHLSDGRVRHVTVTLSHERPGTEAEFDELAGEFRAAQARRRAEQAQIDHGEWDEEER